MTRALLLLALASCSVDVPDTRCVLTDQRILSYDCMRLCALNGYMLAAKGETCEQATECRDVAIGEIVAVTKQAWMQPATDWDFEGELIECEEPVEKLEDLMRRIKSGLKP